MIEFPSRTKRGSLSTKRRVELWTAAHGICHLCNMKIKPGEAWDIEHLSPLWSGGADDEQNMRPAHAKCHRAKSAIETTQRAKEARVKAKHIGAFRSRSPMPGSRASGLKRKMDGTVVRREG